MQILSSAPVKDIKAIIFDIDGTLTKALSWVHFTIRIGGSMEENDAAFAAFKSGQINEGQVKERVLKNWSSNGKIMKESSWNILDEVPIREDAKETVNYLKQKGYLVCMITGSLDGIAQVVGKKLGIEDWYANTTLYFDEEGKLIDLTTYLDEKATKTDQLNDYCARKNILPQQCAVIGDSSNDIGLFEMTGNGIAIASEFGVKELENYARRKIRELSELIDIL